MDEKEVKIGVLAARMRMLARACIRKLYAHIHRLEPTELKSRDTYV